MWFWNNELLLDILATIHCISLKISFFVSVLRVCVWCEMKGDEGMTVGCSGTVGFRDDQVNSIRRQTHTHTRGCTRRALARAQTHKNCSKVVD